MRRSRKHVKLLIRKMGPAERAYYDRRAVEYDDWFHGTGLFANRIRPGWAEELAALQQKLASFRFDSILDVACGTGFLTRSLWGRVTALDQSASMLRVARERLPNCPLVRADAAQMPFRSKQFDCLMTAHLYGHLDDAARRLFLIEAGRVAASILVVDAAKRDDVPDEEQQERVLKDGSRHVVYKRYFTTEKLQEELGGGTAVFNGTWFVAVLV